MLSIVPVRISAVKTFGPDTIPNLLNLSLCITGRAKLFITTVVLAKVAGQNWPTTLTLTKITLSCAHLRPF